MFWKSLVFTFLLAGVFAQDPRENLRAVCKKFGAEDKVDEVIKAFSDLLICLSAQMDMKKLENEFNNAIQTNVFDNFFKKYCAKTPELKSCLHPFIDSSSPCLSSKYDATKIKSSTDALMDFVCSNDGKNISKFISEGGFQCFKEKSKPMEECANRIQKKVENFENMNKAEECATYDELSTCIVTNLKQCSSSTPGNMAESLFSNMRKELSCQEQRTSNNETSAHSAGTSLNLIYKISVFTPIMLILNHLLSRNIL